MIPTDDAARKKAEKLAAEKAAEAARQRAIAVAFEACMLRVRAWLASAGSGTAEKKKKKQQRKPLLVWGPLQSGKKRLIREVLERMHYTVIEPSAGDPLDKCVPGGGGFGKKPEKYAYLMRVEETGTKPLPNAGSAPIVYVCYNPYEQIGGSKDSWEERFVVYKLETGADFSLKSEHSRDLRVSYWDAIQQFRKLNSHNFQLDRALEACDLCSGYLGPVVYYSCAAKDVTLEARFVTDARVDRQAQVTELLSVADLFRQKLHEDIVRIFDSIAPARASQLDGNNVVLTKPDRESKEEKARIKEKIASAAREVRLTLRDPVSDPWNRIDSSSAPVPAKTPAFSSGNTRKRKGAQ